MTLIKSISGIRGTIGGKSGDNLTPPDIVKYAAAYSQWIINLKRRGKRRIVIGRDARPSGKMVSNLISGTLTAMGFHVTDIGLATTPTVEMAVPAEKADGGIIITASHNPVQWNALKLLNHKGEFLSDKEGREILQIAESEVLFRKISFSGVHECGVLTEDRSYLRKHLGKILALPLVDTKAIRSARLTVAVDAVNSVGGIAVPLLLKLLGVKNILPLYCNSDGSFPHNPEPLPEHLTDLSALMRKKQADAGFAVDPDVDRLAIVCEDGSPFGEEYTLVAVADYVLMHHKGNTVSNLSSSMALRDITEKYKGKYEAAAVGEVNVVKKMKDIHAVIGGEGNGGVIYPELHYGRDALVGIALFLSHLARSGKKCSELRRQYPSYYISKNKINLNPETNIDDLLLKIRKKYASQPVKINTSDGLRIDFSREWVHLRKSNTEPIIRIYAESSNKEKADKLAKKIMKEIIR